MKENLVIGFVLCSGFKDREKKIKQLQQEYRGCKIHFTILEDNFMYKIFLDGHSGYDGKSKNRITDDDNYC